MPQIPVAKFYEPSLPFQFSKTSAHPENIAPSTGRQRICREESAPGGHSGGSEGSPQHTLSSREGTPGAARPRPRRGTDGGSAISTSLGLTDVRSKLHLCPVHDDDGARWGALTVLCSSPSRTWNVCSNTVYMILPRPKEGSMTFGTTSSTARGTEVQ